LFFCAEGAAGTIAQGEAPQRGAQPREYGMFQGIEAPAGATDIHSLNLQYITFRPPPFQGLFCFPSITWGGASQNDAPPQAIALSARNKSMALVGTAALLLSTGLRLV
jgi:hypothetical protein